MNLNLALKLFLLFFFWMFLISTNSQYKEKDYLGIEGFRKIHIVNDKQDTISSNKLIEFVDQNEIPIWFGRHFNKIVCDDGLCRMANLWIFWDGVGNYKGFQYDKNNPITKTDHVNFSFEDYSKLHSILSNKNSLLRDIEQEELIDSNYLDGKSGATLIQYRDEIVEKAAYTCHTLWHTVYGYTQSEIQRMISERVNQDYLTKLFNSDLPVYKTWVINTIINNPTYQEPFVNEVIPLIGNKNDDLSNAAIRFINHTIINSENTSKLLIEKYTSLGTQTKIQILTRLAEIGGTIDNEIILFLLKDIEQNDINPYLLVYIYNLINSENLKDNRFINQIKIYSESNNLFIKQISERKLSSISHYKN